MSSAEEKQPLFNNYNKQLPKDGPTDQLKVLTPGRTNNIYDWPWIYLGHIFDYILKKDFQREYIEH